MSLADPKPGRPGAGAAAPEHLLLYEPRTEGHHPGWLRFLCEDLLSAGHSLTVAVDPRPEARAIIDDHLAGLGKEARLVPAFETAGLLKSAAAEVRRIACLMRECKASRVFLCALDEIASGSWRRAAFGLLPPRELRGRMAGIYHRPRFFDAPPSLDRFLKTRGFKRLVGAGWIRPVFVLDEFLAARLRKDYPGVSVQFLPDPCPDGFEADPPAARTHLEVPAGKRVFLFFGTGAARKGLSVAAEAFAGLEPGTPAFLLCVGRQDPAGETARQLALLEQQGRAKVINRYVSTEEERLAFAASDFVLLPYRNHFGTSGVLSRAAAARRPVIASDEQLVGRLTREHGLGIVFTSGSAAALRARLQEATVAGESQIAGWREALIRYANACSRSNYRARLLQGLSSTQSCASCT